MYLHIMATRRITTPQDLGAAVRDARTSAQLTQAELAERADVSREWLIGLERGTRPRAELTKILGVLAALDQPLMLGREEQEEAQEEEEEPKRDGARMTTAEVTRRAIEQSRRSLGTAPLGAHAAAYALGAGKTASALDLDKMAAFLPKPNLSAFLPKPNLSAFLPKTDLSAFLPKTDLSAILPKADIASMLPKTDYSTLMPQPSPDLLRLISELGAARDSDQDGAERDHDRDDVESDVIAEIDDDERSATDITDEAVGPENQDGLW